MELFPKLYMRSRAKLSTNTRPTIALRVWSNIIRDAPVSGRQLII